jgi:hypothetical protein
MLAFDSEAPLCPHRAVFHTTQKCVFLKEKAKLVESRVHYNKIQIGIAEQIFNIKLEVKFKEQFH